MDLNELYRAIPKGRELSLSHNEHGIQFRVVDRSTNKVVSHMIPGPELLRAGAVIEKIFFDHLRTMNATIDRQLISPSTKGAR